MAKPSKDRKPDYSQVEDLRTALAKLLDPRTVERVGVWIPGAHYSAGKEERAWQRKQATMRAAKKRYERRYGR